MDHSMFSLIFKCLQNLNCKSSYKAQWNSIEVIVLDKLIEINTKQLKWDDQMFPEYAVVFDPYDIVYIIRVMFLEVIEDIKFDSSLMMKSLLIADNFDSYFLICFVIFAFQSLSEATFA